MQRSDAIVMVMELCECDLDHLIKVKPFCDQEVIILLHQLGKEYWGEGEREGERKGGRERGREGGREGGRERVLIHVNVYWWGVLSFW